MKTEALKDYFHSGILLFKKGEEYEVKKHFDRFFYPKNSKHKVLIPNGILKEIEY